MNYEELLEQCATTRQHINSELWGEYKILKSNFEQLTPLPGKYFKYAADLLYYKGGYPNENSPPRDEEMADQIASALWIFKAINNPKLLQLFKDRGITIEFDKEPNDVVSNGSEIGNLLEKACEIQGEICSSSNEIKKHGAKQAEDEFNIPKPNFMKAVSISARNKLSGRKYFKKALDKALDISERFPEAVQPLENL